MTDIPDTDRYQHFWSLTVNFPDIYLDDNEAQLEHLQDGYEQLLALYAQKEIVYFACQYERGKNKRLHLQAMCVTADEHDRIWLHNRVPQAHISGMYEKSTPRALRNYCTNPRKRCGIDNVWTHGRWPRDDFMSWLSKDDQAKPPQRSPYREIIESIISGTIQSFEDCVAYDAATAYSRKRELKEALKDMHNKKLQVAAKKTENAEIKLRCWQHWLFRMLDELPGDNRYINFVVDTRGGAGKSRFCELYELYGKKKSVYLTLMKKTDLAHVTDTIDTEVYFIDVTREQVEYMDSIYPFAEELKNGRLGSGKYDGETKRACKNHVVIFMNQMPRLGGDPHPSRREWNEVRERYEPVLRDAPLSADRYRVLVASADSTYTQVWSPDHPVWGTTPMPFRTYTDRGPCTVMDRGTPYVPPLVEDHGPAFSSDNAGDGPSTPAEWERYLMTGKHRCLKKPDHRTTENGYMADKSYALSKFPMPRDFASYRDFEWYLVHKYKDKKDDKDKEYLVHEKYIHKLRMSTCHDEIRRYFK